MRGFTMLLVVYWHVVLCCFDSTDALSSFLWASQFRQFFMALFFFVSGFVLYRPNRSWRKQEIAQFFAKKWSVLLLFPAVCMFLCMMTTSRGDISDALWKPLKGGYWFTFVLFEYYVVYVAIQLMLKPLKNNVASDVIQVVMALLVYFGVRLLMHLQYEECTHGTLLSLFSVSKFDTFIFFVGGTLARKHFPQFEKMLDNSVFMLSCFVVYLLFNMFHLPDTVSILCAGTSGLLVVFMFFRRYQHCFASDRRLGSVMQYVGKRTLDIYLLHYFFVYTNDLTGLVSFYDGSSILGSCCSFMFSFIVIGLCLVVSNVLRMSPFISKYCFGVKVGALSR